MPLMIEKNETGFDKEAICKGNFIRAKYHVWPNPQNGIVVAVSDKKLTVLYLPEIGNVSNYFVIPVSEAASGLWTVEWSADLETVQRHGIDT